MRILITGIGGFAGKHLASYLLATTPDVEIHGTVLDTAPASDVIVYHSLDLKNADAVLRLLLHVRPQHIYHLAAQAFVPRSFDAPWETLENNILAQLNLILACLALDTPPRMLIISSAEIYGAVQPTELPLNENTLLRPANPYSVSKVAQDMLALQYYISHSLPIMRARPFNHIGPGQDTRFVAADFALQIARIEAGQQQPVIHVGNLSAQRDFTDVRDIVRAYRLIMERGTPGEAYNIASGEAYSIQALLDTLLSYSDVPIKIQIDTSRLRPSDVPVIRGDSSRLRGVTGWQPTISFRQTLLDILNDCRQRTRLTAQTPNPD